MKRDDIRTARISDEIEIDFLDLFGYLMKRLPVILAVTLVTTAIGFVKTWLFTTPLYSSTAKMYVSSPGDSVINLTDLQVGSSLANDYIEIFKTWEVNQQVIQNLSLPYDVKDLLKMIDITNPSSTRIINIEVVSEDPKEAAVIANEFACVASEYITNVMRTDAPSVLSTALCATEPDNIHYFRTLLIGAMLGFAAVVAVLTIVYLSDDIVRTGADIQKALGFAPLAVIPLTQPVDGGPENGKRAGD